MTPRPMATGRARREPLYLDHQKWLCVGHGARRRHRVLRHRLVRPEHVGARRPEWRTGHSQQRRRCRRSFHLSGPWVKRPASSMCSTSPLYYGTSEWARKALNGPFRRFSAGADQDEDDNFHAILHNLEGPHMQNEPPSMLVGTHAYSQVGLGCTVALYCRSFTAYQIYEEIRCLFL